VVGYAARFPASRDPAEFWRNVRDGRDCISRLTDADLLAVNGNPVDDPAALLNVGAVFRSGVRIR